MIADNLLNTKRDRSGDADANADTDRNADSDADTAIYRDMYNHIAGTVFSVCLSHNSCYLSCRTVNFTQTEDRK